MRKQFVLVVLFLMALAGLSLASAEQGEAIFKSHGCTLCHHADKSSKTNPSLRDIAQAYQGQDGRLNSYLRGQSEAIVNPEKGAMMKRQIEKTKVLADADRQALVDFIMSHKP